MLYDINMFRALLPHDFVSNKNHIINKIIYTSGAWGTMPSFGKIMMDVWYLQSSRLHFIGTWRNRYRKRFPVLSTGVNCESSGANVSDTSGRKVIIHVDMVKLT